MPKILSDRIVYDHEDWLAGLVPQANNSLALNVGEGAAYMRNVNPYRALGAIIPGFAPAAITNEDNLQGLAVSGDSDFSGSTPYAYLISQASNSALIQRLNLSSDTISGGATAFPHNVTHTKAADHASFSSKDLVIFSITSGVSSTTSTMAMYSFSDDVDGDVGAYDISSGLEVFYDNFLSTQPEGGLVLTTDPHPMIIGGDGVLYIGNGNTLIALDGTTGGSGTASTKLTFPKGTVIRSFTKMAKYLIIYTSRSNIVSAASYRGNSIAYFWDYVAGKFNFDYDLNDNLVTAGFNLGGVPGCFTYGRAGDGGALTTKIKMFNGSRFESEYEYRKNPPGHGSVDIYDNLLVFAFGDGAQNYIGSFGSPWPGRIKRSFNFWGEPQGSSLDLTNTGICKNLGGLKLYVSGGAGMSSFSSAYGPNTSSGSFWYGILASPSFPFKTRGRIKSIKIHYRNTFTAGRTATVALQIDAALSVTVTVASAIGTIASAEDTIVEYFKDTNGVPFPEFHSFAPRITWDTGTDNTDAPPIKKIEIFFEPIQFKQPV